MAEHHRAVDPRPDFPRLEEEVLVRWRERAGVREAVRRREGPPEAVVYAGPPTAHGRPGSHHALPPALQDLVPYCPRAQTTLSSHEVSPGCQDVADPSVYVKLPVVEPRGPLQPGDVLLVWTTTPWTLVSNAAVAVDPDLSYVRARADGEVHVLSEPARERVLGEASEAGERSPGRELVGTRYEPPFPCLAT